MTSEGGGGAAATQGELSCGDHTASHRCFCFTRSPLPSSPPKKKPKRRERGGHSNRAVTPGLFSRTDYRLKARKRRIGAAPASPEEDNPKKTDSERRTYSETERKTSRGEEALKYSGGELNPN
ncbi:Hypothetical predicted protein [Scomber scombrus]|uniref:Uncharacterized protein n=1 Tax=Scomber scombrus TaxID=13677 RepID=A0AAV1PZ89_SCOSC